MSWIVANSGTTSALTVNSETTLYTDTTNATYQAFIELSGLASPSSSPVSLDMILVRVYTMTLLGGTLRQVWEGTFVAGAANTERVTPPLASNQSYSVTVTQIQATYSISGSAGTIPDGSAVTGLTSGATGTVRVAGGGNVPASGFVILLNTNNIAFVNGEVVQLTTGNTLTLSNAGTGAVLPWKILRI